jgi:hypothetical protein
VFFPALVASMLYGVAGSNWDSLELKGCNSLIVLVRTEGLEPSREISQGILSLLSPLFLSHCLC